MKKQLHLHLNIKSLAVLAALSLALQSCYMVKPVGKVSSYDYNGRVKVENAGMRQMPSRPGRLLMGALPLGVVGGFVGHTIAGPYNAENGIIFGTLTGAILGYSLLGFVKGDVEFVSDPMQWMTKSNMEDYIIIKGLTRNFTLMHPSVEKDYIVKDLQDIRDFRKAFPHSSYTHSVFFLAVDELPESNWPELLKLYPFDLKSPLTAKMAERVARDKKIVEELDALKEKEMKPLEERKTEENEKVEDVETKSEATSPQNP